MMDKAIELALKTWYPPDHPLHLNPHHPLGKLLGEWGELLDDYMKLLYKPDYESNFIDELGDIWYYIRILAHQKKYEPKQHKIPKDYTIDKLIAIAISETANIFNTLLDRGYVGNFCLDTNYSVLLKLLEIYGFTLDELTERNWQKLQPGSMRGEEWMKAR